MKQINSIGVVWLLMLVLSACATTFSRPEPLRLDGSSTLAAERSFSRMLAASTESQQQELLIAVLKLNFAGTTTAMDVVEIMADGDSESIGILRIRHKVDGLTRQEIVDLGSQVTGFEVEVHE